LACSDVSGRISFRLACGTFTPRGGVARDNPVGDRLIEGLMKNDVHLVDRGGGEVGTEPIPVGAAYMRRVEALKLDASPPRHDVLKISPRPHVTDLRRAGVLTH
jgi:hypothetical protein